MSSFSSRLMHLRAEHYLRRHQPDLVTITGGYQNLLTVRAINLVLQDKLATRPARQEYTQPADFAAAVLGTSAPTSPLQAARQLIGSRLRETVQDPEPEVIIPIVNCTRPGQIDELARRFPPAIAVLVNSASAHLDFFSAPDRRAHEQASLAIAADQAGHPVVLNIDDPHLAAIRHLLTNDPITVSRQHPATIHCNRLQRLSPGQLKGLVGEVVIQGRPYELHLPHLVAPFQIPSVLSALAIALQYNIDIKAALHDLKALRPPGGYLSVEQTRPGATVLDSSQENPPEYLNAVLDAFSNLQATRKLLILGDMPGLSRTATRWYRHLGTKAAAAADILVTVGPESRQLQAAALSSTPTPHGLDTHHFMHPVEAATWLTTFIRTKDLVLLAGHQSANLDLILQRLKK